MPTLKKLLNETTEVPAATSAALIMQELVSIGASSVEQHYANGRIAGMRWTMPVGGAKVCFSMPVRVEGVYQILAERQARPLLARQADLRARAERIAWRHLYRWVQAQVAIIQTSMLAPAEPFMPFAAFRDGSGKTLFEVFVERGQLAAPGATETRQ